MSSETSLPHLSPDVIKRLLTNARSMTIEQRRTAAGHIRTCQDCRERLSRDAKTELIAIDQKIEQWQNLTDKLEREDSRDHSTRVTFPSLGGWLTAMIMRYSIPAFLLFVFSLCCVAAGLTAAQFSRAQQGLPPVVLIHFFGITDSFQATALQHGLQLTILLLLATTGIQLFFMPRVADVKDQECIRQFRLFWRATIVSWASLYAALTAKALWSRELGKASGNLADFRLEPFQAMPFDVFTNVCFNAATASLLVLFFVLTVPSVEVGSQCWTVRFRSIVCKLGATVLLVAGLEILLKCSQIYLGLHITSSYAGLEKTFSYIYSVVAGASICLLVSMISSRWVGAPVWFVFTLHIYGGIQFLYPVFDTEHYLVGTICFSYALFAKLALFATFSWMCSTGLIRFIFQQENQDRNDCERRQTEFIETDQTVQENINDIMNPHHKTPS